MRKMTAEELLRRALECVTCGKVHQPRQVTECRQSWAGSDGHPYRTRIYEMTGHMDSSTMNALQVLAGGGS